MPRTPSPFFVNNVYSLGYWLKDFGFYPRKWPLYTYMDHGITLFDKIPHHEIENDAPLIFKFSPRLVEEYRKVGNKPVYNILNPTVHCRIRNKIEKDPNARGTLYFPAHTTEMIDDETQWDKFISDLEKVPEHFKPLDICLHPTDVKKGLDKVFAANGYKVFTAGNAYTDDFAENLYRIMKNYKFTMSNVPGSYLFYSVEMNIPFSLFGSDPVLVNKGDENIELGAYTSYTSQPTYQKTVKLFSGFHTEISSAQAEFVNLELGKDHGISRIKTSYLLYRSLLIYQFWILKRKIYGMPTLSGLKDKIRLLRYWRMLSHKRDSEYELINKGLIPLPELLRLKSDDGIRSSMLFGKTIEITDPYWHQHSLKEIFVDEVYKFRPSTDAPYILDCGSNIGLSIIYFKIQSPKARIVAFEPDKEISGALKNNLSTFGYNDVEVKHRAIWTAETTLNFTSTGDLGGRLLQSPKENSPKPSVQVQTVRLRDYLGERVDFLKMDIEGAEVDVLQDCSDLLHHVQHMFVEYHSDPAKEQELDKLLKILKEAGFRVYIKEAWNNLPFPFLQKDDKPCYDMQLNIFAYRA